MKTEESDRMLLSIIHSTLFYDIRVVGMSIMKYYIHQGSTICKN